MKSIKIILSNKFQKKLKQNKTYYGTGNTSNKIINEIKKINLNKVLIKKFFNTKLN